MDFLTAQQLPWLGEPIARLRQAAQSGRFPHSLLLLGAPGLGAEELARWAAGFVLCEGRGERPCGDCASCLLLRADTHPDVTVLRVEEDSKQIRVEQVRALIEALTLKSYRRGYKAGLIEAAQHLNVNGANALLKTLEEPTQDTVLILCAEPAHRLPATIASRCLRLTLRVPPRDQALAWLAAQQPGQRHWDAALSLAGGAPLRALAIAAAGLADIDAEMRETVQGLSQRTVDPSLVAEAWLRSEPQLRLVWLENWITNRITGALGGVENSANETPVRLPGLRSRSKICQLYDLLDAARTLRRLASSSMNQQLAFENLLLGGLEALSGQ